MEEQKPRRLNRLSLLIYGLLSAGMISIGIYLDEEVFGTDEFAIMFVFAAMASLAWAFYMMREGKLYRWLSIVMGVISVLTGYIWIIDEGLLPEELGIALIFFMAAGLLMFTMNRRNEVDADARALNKAAEWRKLGTGPEADRAVEVNPAERDVPMEVRR